MKKIFALLLAVVMVLGLAACGEKPAETTKAPETQAPQPQTSADPGKQEETKAPEPVNPGTSSTYDGSAVTIRFYHTIGQKNLPVLEKYIEKFNELFPNITVETVFLGGYDDVRDQISTEINVGGQPNVAYCYPDHVAVYNLAGAVQTLDEFINSTSVV